MFLNRHLRALTLSKTVAMDAMSSCFMVINPRQEITYCNPALLHMLKSADDTGSNFDAKSWIGDNLAVRIGARFDEISVRAHTGAGIRCSVTLDGHTFDLTAMPLLSEKRYLGAVIEWTRASARLENAERAASLEAMSKAQAIIEFKMDGTIITANKNFLEALSYSLAEIQGRHHSIFVGSERDGKLYREFWASLNRGEFQTGEYKRLGKGGKEVWILATYNPILDETGAPVKVVKVATDITAQKFRTADLSGQITAIGKSQAVIEFGMEGTILNANENFLHALGYTIDEIKGRHHSMFLSSDEHNSSTYRDFWANLARGEYQAGEYRRFGKGGREVWIQASYNPIFDLNGVPWKVVKYASDTTEQVVARLKSERVRSMMENVAAGAEELNASVREISEAMLKSRDTAAAAVAKVEVADGRTQRLASAAQAMTGIVELIANITGQINLLALNATIESARAGDAGRGFAVVASEVKNLANQAKQATDRISGEIGGLNAISADVVGGLIDIKSQIQMVSEYVSATAAAIEEQSTVTAEMSASMQRAAAEAAG